MASNIKETRPYINAEIDTSAKIKASIAVAEYRKSATMAIKSYIRASIDVEEE